MAADAVNETPTETMPVSTEPPAAPSVSQALEPRRERINGLKKAAVLLVTLGREGAAQVFKHLPEHDIEQLTLEMARLQQVPTTTTHQVFQEAEETLVAGGAWSEGGYDFA